jgi:GDPmannose 4,6-dehydratase
MKTALVTGASGQDGAYLCSLLLKKGYRVIATDRRSARSNFWRLRYLKIENKVIQEELELNEINQIYRLFTKYKFDEVYNLAAQSFVAASFSSPIETANVTGIGPIRILEVIRNQKRKIKFYQASSSEMFGKALEIPQTEKTPFYPRSPYACAKLMAHYLVKNYRESYNLFCVSGILFNHESPLRGEEFVTRKITMNLCKIKLKKIDFFELGNIYSKRDWGYAGDYVEAMWKMMQLKTAEDLVISTGKTYSIKKFVDMTTKELKINCFWKGQGLNEVLVNKDTNKVIIKINKKFYRPAEVDILIGDSSKAKKILNWKPLVGIKELIKKMVHADLKILNKTL